MSPKSRVRDQWGAAMTSGPVPYSVADAVATITLDRPETRNSLTDEVKVALRAAVEQAAADATVRCVLLTATGRAFSVGQDLREHAERLATRPLSEVWSTVSEHYVPIATALATMAKPVVAAVNGVAAGAGASLAFAADFRLVADSGGFNTAFAAIGLCCDTGASWTLPRLVGHGRAVELLMRPRTIAAAEAYDLGLATRVVPVGDLADEATAFARELAAGPTLAYAAIKQAVAYAEAHDLEAALANEARLMALTGGSQDHRDAVDAFVAKRPPTFSGH